MKFVAQIRECGRRPGTSIQYDGRRLWPRTTRDRTVARADWGGWGRVPYAKSVAVLPEEGKHIRGTGLARSARGCGALSPRRGDVMRFLVLLHRRGSCTAVVNPSI